MVDELPPAPPPPTELIDRWHETWDHRIAVEVGVAVLACRRARAAAVSCARPAGRPRWRRATDDFATYRQLDVRFHIGLAEATDNPRLVTMATEVQGDATRLIALIAHPAEVLSSSNMQHRRILAAVASGDEGATAREMAEHLRGTEHVLAGLLPPS